MRIDSIVVLTALCFSCGSAFCDPMGYLETFDSGNMSWRTDEATNSSLFSGTDPVSYDNVSDSVYARYPTTTPSARTSIIYADVSSSSPAGTLAGNVDYTNVPGLSVWLKLSTDDYIPGVAFFIASNNNTGSSTLSTSSNIFAYNPQASNLGTTWTQYTCTDFTNWSRWRPFSGEGMTLAQALADVDAIGVMYTDMGQTSEYLYLDSFAVAPEPATLLMMGPAAAFLAARLRKKKAVSATRLRRMR